MRIRCGRISLRATMDDVGELTVAAADYDRVLHSRRNRLWWVDRWTSEDGTLWVVADCHPGAGAVLVAANGNACA